jgi:hypothetical protein
MIRFLLWKIGGKRFGMIALKRQYDIDVGKPQQKVIVIDPKRPVICHRSWKADSTAEKQFFPLV